MDWDVWGVEDRDQHTEKDRGTRDRAEWAATRTLGAS